MHRPPVERPGDFTVLPHKMYLAAKRARCQIQDCHAVYQSLKSYASHPGRLTLVKQHIHHLVPRRYLHQYAIYEHYQGNLLSVCATCHGRAKVVEDRLFLADLMGFMEGMRRINFPVRKIAGFACSVGLTEFQRWLI